MFHAAELGRMQAVVNLNASTDASRSPGDGSGDGGIVLPDDAAELNESLLYFNTSLRNIVVDVEGGKTITLEADDSPEADVHGILSSKAIKNHIRSSHFTASSRLNLFQPSCCSSLP